MRTLLLLISRGLRQHAFTSLLAGLLIALATGGMLTAWTVRASAREAFASATGPFDAVLGARGSPLQIVMAGVLHMEAAPGRVPGAEVAVLRGNPAVAAALPVAIGDNHRGWRLAGVTTDYFSPDLWNGHAAPRVVAGGRLFKDGAREIVAGAFAARQLRLRVGDHLHPEHGLDHDAETSGDHEHEDEFTVCGILAPTGTPMDRVLWVPLHTIQTLDGHDPAAADSVSFILVKLRPDAGVAAFQLAREINREGGAFTLAWPAPAIIAGLFDRLVWLDQVLGLGALGAMVTAALCVMIALQGSLAARRHDWAVMRAIGARRSVLLAAVTGEAGAIGLGGILVGLAFHAALGAFVVWQVRLRTGVVLDLSVGAPVTLWGPSLMWALCLLSGLWPAWSVYNTPVHDQLSRQT